MTTRTACVICVSTMPHLEWWRSGGHYNGNRSVSRHACWFSPEEWAAFQRWGKAIRIVRKRAGRSRRGNFKSVPIGRR